MILGVYVKKGHQASGYGGTSRAAEQNTYWFVRRVDDDTYEVQPLNQNHLPSGVLSAISKGDLLRDYLPVPDYYERRTLPVLQSLQRKLDQGEKLFAANQLDAAEAEFVKVLYMDQDHPQANLRLGDIYCQKKNVKHLKTVLARILNNDQVFAEKERHRFNEFGMNLRKNGLLEEALAYYAKAVEINEADEHLQFNMARVLWEKNEKEKCLEHLENAMRLNPRFEEAHRFLEYVRQQMG
jgi:tetratricopeptide (TPR) repeat protein